MKAQGYYIARPLPLDALMAWFVAPAVGAGMPSRPGEPAMLPA